MQLQLDLFRTERGAERTDAALREIGVAAAERALIRALIEHPDAQLIDADRKLVLLTISCRALLRWIAGNLPGGKALSRHHSVVTRALAAWQQRGACVFQSGRPSSICVDFSRLNEWHQAQVEQRVCQFEKRHADCSLKERKKDHSFFPSKGAAAPPDQPAAPAAPAASDAELPLCPLAAVDFDTPEAELSEALLRWWNDNRLRDAGHDAESVVGAILAARHRRATDFDRYVAGCLRGGVGESWRRQAAVLIKRANGRGIRRRPAEAEAAAT